MPFGPYADFDECVADNQDKDSPEAFCRILEEMLEGRTDGDETTMRFATNRAVTLNETEPPVVMETASEDFHAVVILEETWTGDGRYFETDSLTWRDLPLPLMALDRTTEAHMEARLVGNFTRLERIGREIHGFGSWVQSDDPEVMRLQGLVQRGELRGISADLDDVEMEILVPNEEAMAYDEDGKKVYAMEAPMMRFTAGRIMGACYDEQTEVLAESSGWTKFADLPKGERVATMNPKTSEFEWQEPTHYTNDEWDGKMIRFTSGGRQAKASDPKKMHKGIDLLVTPNHRMLVESTKTGERLFMTAEELASKSNRSYKIPAVSVWDAPDVWRVKIQPVREMANQAQKIDFDGDAFAAFMGAYLSEGSLGVRKVITISQQPTGKGRELFEDVMSRMFSSFYADERGFVAHHTAFHEWLRQFGTAREKFVPEEIKNMSSRQIKIFLDAYIAGDGDKEGRRIYTSSRRMADDLQELAQKAGMWAHIVERDINGRSIDGRKIEANGPGYVVNLRNRPNSRPAAACWDWKAEWVENHKGMVRCVTVPNEALYVRRNGVPIWCGNTIVPFPALQEAFIESMANLTAALMVSPDVTGHITMQNYTDQDDSALTAGGFPVEAPLCPPAAWFTDPSLMAPTPMTVTDDGRIFGHLATWESCHVGFADQCVRPPRSASAYAHFTTGEIITDEGTRFPVGQITMGTGHAPLNASANRAAAHYDDTGLAVADVRCGEDNFGIWMAGALRPDVEPLKIRALMASDVSGDWRRIGSALELVGVLAVNVPGFPKLRETEGVLASLVASLSPSEKGDPERLRKAADRIAATIGRSKAERVAELAEKVRGKDF